MGNTHTDIDTPVTRQGSPVECQECWRIDGWFLGTPGRWLCDSCGDQQPHRWHRLANDERTVGLHVTRCACGVAVDEDAHELSCCGTPCCEQCSRESADDSCITCRRRERKRLIRSVWAGRAAGAVAS